MCNVYYKKIKVFLPICKPIVKHLKNYTFRGTIQQLVTGVPFIMYTGSCTVPFKANIYIYALHLKVHIFSFLSFSVLALPRNRTHDLGVASANALLS